jgi:hypothetical protein
MVILGFLFFDFIEPYLKMHASVLGDDWIEPFVFCLWSGLPWLFALWLRKSARERMLLENRDPNNPAPIG